MRWLRRPAMGGRVGHSGVGLLPGALTMRRLILVLVALALVGCAAKPPSLFFMYADASYYYGRIQAKTEIVCTAPIPSRLIAFCQEAAETQKVIQTLNPLIREELARQEVDWAKVMKYVDLIFSLATKAL